MELEGNAIQKNILIRTNLLICAILIIGFVSVSVVSYNSNTGVFRKNIEQVSTLTSEGIYHKIETYFAKPIHVGLTMANDTLLKRFLSEEALKKEDEEYLRLLQSYLDTYRNQNGFDSVYLASAKTNRYYHFDGAYRDMSRDHTEDEWYYAMVDGDDAYALKVDNDQLADNMVTVFINCKIADDEGNGIGAVGVGLKVSNLQELLKDYDQRFDLKANLIDRNGEIQISSHETGEDRINLFNSPVFTDSKELILETGEEEQTFWNHKGKGDVYIVAHYVPALKWILVLENDMAEMRQHFQRQFAMGIFATGVIIVLVLFIVNRIILTYNKRLLKLTVSQEMEYGQLLQDATMGLYENILEFDITHSRACGENTLSYMDSLDIGRNTPYPEIIKLFAQKIVMKEYMQGYLATFSAENVLKAYHDGLVDLYYDFLMSSNGVDFRWMRIRARIFYWGSDRSVRMITYRQDIDEERKQEIHMRRLAQIDTLTGLYNKTTAQERVTEIIKQSAKEQIHALLMVDIDHFKEVNDSYGHAVGDQTIGIFASVLKNYFRGSDICGRFGGDEFLVLIRDVPSIEWLKYRLSELSKRLHSELSIEGNDFWISSSIGVSVYPKDGTDFEILYRRADEALYASKKKGRNQYMMSGDIL